MPGAPAGAIGGPLGARDAAGAAAASCGCCRGKQAGARAKVNRAIQIDVRRMTLRGGAYRRRLRESSEVGAARDESPAGRALGPRTSRPSKRWVFRGLRPGLRVRSLLPARPQKRRMEKSVPSRMRPRTTSKREMEPMPRTGRERWRTRRFRSICSAAVPRRIRATASSGVRHGSRLRPATCGRNSPPCSPALDHREPGQAARGIHPCSIQ